jgi:hypothetical protein
MTESTRLFTLRLWSAAETDYGAQPAWGDLKDRASIEAAEAGLAWVAWRARSTAEAGRLARGAGLVAAVRSGLPLAVAGPLAAARPGAGAR